MNQEQEQQQELIDKITTDVTKAVLEELDKRIDERLAAADEQGKKADGQDKEQADAAKEKLRNIMRK